MRQPASTSPAEQAVYVLFLLATGLGIWIGGSFLASRHLDKTSLPRRD